MKEQKVVTVRQIDGEYYNFFCTPGSIGSLSEHVSSGWTVKYIKDIGSEAVVVFEREIRCGE